MLRGSLANFTVSEAIPNSEISMLAMKISLLAEFLTVAMQIASQTDKQLVRKIDK